MGPYIAFNIMLVGLFGFGALHYGIIWWQSRHERVLAVFALHCLLCAVYCPWLVVLATAKTIGTAQAALDARTSIALLVQATVVWILWLVSGYRARTFATLTASTLLVLAAINLWMFPLTGIVTGLRRARLPWGEEVVFLERGPASWWLWLIYAAVILIHLFGLAAAARVWAKDRAGALLIAGASVGALAGNLVGARVDLFRSSAPYIGASPYVIWAVLLAVLISREYALRAKQVAASERRFRAIFDQAFQFTGLMNVDGTLLEANRTALAFAGIREQDVVGKPFWETPWWSHSADLQQRLREAVREAAAGTMVRFEATHPRPGGQLASVDFSLKPVCDEQGGVTLLIPEGRDITELKQAEVKRKELEAQLFQAQKMEEIGQLAGGVAHDFNNVLTVILGYSELLLAKTPLADPQRGMLDGIRYAADRASSVTRQLLAFSRKQVLEPCVLDLNAAVRDVLEMLRRLIREDVQLTIALAPKLCSVKVDPGQIVQVILNLAVNARDAMPDGGKLTLETRNVELDESFVAAHPEACTGSFVLLAVADTGIGMTPEVKAHAFEPFFTTKEAGRGTGLGLAVVQGIIEQSGGFVELCSEPGAGTTVKIFLPAVKEKPEVPASPRAVESARGSETVLLVEDDAAVRELAALALERSGYVVLKTAGSGEAIRRMDGEGQAIDLLVTDVIMPEMSGRQLADALRTRRPGLRTLFLSGYTADVVVGPDTLQVGEAFLQKPFRTAALAQKVRELLDGPLFAES